METQINQKEIKDILENSKTIAMIGVSSEKKGEDPKNLKRKPANIVMKYMQNFGYKVFPINQNKNPQGQFFANNLKNARSRRKKIVRRKRSRV